MDIIQEKPEVVSHVVEGIKDRYGISKARPDIHMTDCLYCLRKAYWDKLDRLPPSNMEVLYYILGLGSQDAIIGKDSAVDSQSVLCVNGIYLSPDLVGIDSNGNPYPVELKTTRISNKRLHSKDIPDGWIKQLKGYCYAMKATSGVLIAVPIISPEIIPFRLVFTQDELLQQWADIVSKAEILKKFLDKNAVPDICYNQEWECKNCRYKLRCQTQGSNPPELPPARSSKLSDYKLQEC